MSATTSVASASTAWLRRYHPGPERPVRLVCFPHAGGSASFFHPASARFADTAEVLAVQYPGRQDRRREPCIDDIAVLADRLAAVLRPLPSKPTVYFGHSMGAVLAFETAWRLGDVGHLIASGRRAPSTVRSESVHRLDDDGVIAELKLLNGTSTAVLSDDEILRMALPAIRGDYRAIETYTCPPERAVSCPITVLTGDSDPKTTEEEARAWSRHTDSTCTVRVFPGGHFFLTEHLPEVNTEIAAALRALGAP
ncbi:thioesterase II family protein [Actinokineospora guangxiensis]|uniref:Thioesterase II family protein n=1 Tax=Actinokineospora guangxiensis TaxID=1490288 RepID=A0ABW0ESU8_9PSEU